MNGKATWTRNWCLGLALSAGIGCGTRVEVLENRNQGSSRAPIWPSCDPEQFETSAHTGDGCGFGGESRCPQPDNCTMCGTRAGCGHDVYSCDQSGTLRESTTLVSDCDSTNDFAGSMIATNTVPWTACTTALADGHSADTCSGSWICARHSDDPCCVEAAYCGTDNHRFTNGPALTKVRTCSTDCQAIAPRSGVAPITTCSEARSAVLRAGTPCTGAFICQGARDVSETGADSPDSFGGLVWCDGSFLQFTSVPVVGYL